MLRRRILKKSSYYSVKSIWSDALVFFAAKSWIRFLKIILLLFIIALVFNSPKIIKAFYPLEYWDIIYLQAQENNIDPYLIAAIIKTESNFRPRAASPEGAQGLMQLMPQTGESVAREIGKKILPQSNFLFQK